MTNTFDLIEFKKNIVEKMPFIIDRAIANFSQLSSFDKFGEIIVLISILEQIGKNPISALDTKEEIEKYSTEEEMSNFIVLANIFTEKINALENILRSRTSIYDESNETSEMDIETIEKWNSSEKHADSVLDVGKAW